MNAAILAEQKELKAMGLYRGTLDGVEGPLTRAARSGREAYNAVAPKGMNAGWVPDSRSAGNIATLLPAVRPVAVAFLRELSGTGATVKIISGTRTWDEQDALYAKGRTAPGSIVTNARGGYSNHNFGIAFDIGIFEGTRYCPDSPLYAKAGAIGKTLGLAWGGDWKTIKDEPHFQLTPPWARNLSERDMLAGLRTRKLQGKDLWT